MVGPLPPSQPLQPVTGFEIAAGVSSAHARARVLMAVLLIGLLIRVGGIASSIAQHALLSSMAAGIGLAPGQADANDARERVIAVLKLLALLATVVTWLVWQYRAYANLRLVGTRETEYTPGWSVGYWFIPLLNLFRPYQITAELWSHSEIGNARDPIGGLSGPALVGVWWGSWLITNFFARLYSTMSDSAKTVQGFISVTNYAILHDVLYIVATIIALVVIRRIDSFQMAFTTTAQTSTPPSPT